VEHCAETFTLLCKLAGVQLVKPPRWQVSQLVLDRDDTSWNGV
jgi:hypothetical protein